METVAFYSYKGGVGRTLLVANTAQFLALSGRRVVVLDLDLEAPGMLYKLGNSEALARAASGTLPGAVDELLNTLEGRAQKRGLRKTAIEVALPAGSNGALLLIPAGSAPSHAYWAALERLNSALKSIGPNGGLPEAILELQARIALELDPEFLLIDSRTGITELGGLATSILADRVVCLTTAAAESVEGTQVVAQALHAAPRLSTQRPLRVEYLLTRVPSASASSPHVARLREVLGDTVTVLPHDSGIANEERLLAHGRLGQAAKSGDEDDDGKELFSATLSWIAGAFPGHQQDAERARHRMEAVHHTWQHLTTTTDRADGWNRSRNAWPEDRLRERVRYEKDKKWRDADIVAYDRPASDKAAKPLMIIEYVDREDRDTVARWWLNQTQAPVVAVLSETSDRRLYSGESRWDSRAHHSDRWDIPLPDDFKTLTDPTDVSVDSLLNAVRRGHAKHLDRIVTEWFRVSASTLHGGAPWKPQLARKIVDALAGVDDEKLAREVLWAVSRHLHHRSARMGPEEGSSDDLLLSDLFAPLLWRLPPEASIEIFKEHGHRGMRWGRPLGMLAIGLLARDLLGLRYDPDATFRLEGQRILDPAGLATDADQDRGLYGLVSKFRHTEISFEMSSELPPLARPETDSHEEERERVDLATLVSDRIAARALVTTGLLGDYQARVGRVVLYETAIAHCAEKLALRARHVGSVTLIHETIHALTHLGRDLDGRMWPEFALPAADGPLFEPSWFHETLTQYFTHRHLVRLRDPALLHAFEAMSNKQVPEYRAWQRIKGMAIEDVRNWFMSIRRGVGAASPWTQLLFDATRDESR